jgi:DNA invertase Pin-like site-specific DNA recombinase
VGLQLLELREYCERRGWQIVCEYCDVGISGTKEKRPELDKLLADARRRRSDTVIVWKFDRFARSVSHLLRALENFQALGIEFVSLTEGVDTSTPTGKIVFTVLGAVAELERSLICERVRAGLRNARAKGKRLGRPKVALDPARIAALRKSGLGWKKISRELGIGVGIRRCQLLPRRPTRRRNPPCGSRKCCADPLPPQRLPDNCSLALPTEASPFVYRSIPWRRRAGDATSRVNQQLCWPQKAAFYTAFTSG